MPPEVCLLPAWAPSMQSTMMTRSTPPQPTIGPASPPPTTSSPIIIPTPVITTARSTQDPGQTNLTPHQADNPPDTTPANPSTTTVALPDQPPLRPSPANHPPTASIDPPSTPLPADMSTQPSGTVLSSAPNKQPPPTDLHTYRPYQVSNVPGLTPKTKTIHMPVARQPARGPSIIPGSRTSCTTWPLTTLDASKHHIMHPSGYYAPAISCRAPPLEGRSAPSLDALATHHFHTHHQHSSSTQQHTQATYTHTQVQQVTHLTGQQATQSAHTHTIHGLLEESVSFRTMILTMTYGVRPMNPPLTFRKDTDLEVHAIRHLLNEALKYRNLTPPKSNLPLTIPFLAHSDFQANTQRWLAELLQQHKHYAIPLHLPTCRLREAADDTSRSRLHNHRRWEDALRAPPHHDQLPLRMYTFTQSSRTRPHHPQ